MSSYSNPANPWKNLPLVGSLIDTIQTYLKTGLDTDLGSGGAINVHPSRLSGYPNDATKSLLGDASWGTISTAAGTSGALSAIPAASAASGKFYYATDQAVLYFSDGTSWHRQGDPAGATHLWFSPTAPTGYVLYNGSTLPGSTGIYADLATHLGGTTLPDTRGRMPIGLGLHADVSTVGNNEGQTDATKRRAKHGTTNALGASHSLTLPNHTHGQHSEAGGGSDGVTWYNQRTQNSGDFAVATHTGNPDSNPAINGAVSLTGSIGTNVASDSLDTSPYLTFAFIAKL